MIEDENILSMRLPRQSIEFSEIGLAGEAKKMIKAAEQKVAQEIIDYLSAEFKKDLETEQQITGTDDEVNAIKKALGRKVFMFVKSIVAALTGSVA